MNSNAPILALLAFFAGCIEFTSPSDGNALDSRPPGTDSAMEITHWLNGTKMANYTQISLPFYRFTDGEPVCLEWKSSQIHHILDGGYVRATWDATQESHRRLALHAGIMPVDMQYVEGESPLTIHIPELKLSGHNFRLGINAPSPTVVIDQPVTMEYSIPYRGVPNPEALEVYC